VLLIVVGVSAVLLLKLLNPTFASQGQLFILLPLALFWLWVLRNNPVQWLNANRDLREGRVAEKTGVVTADFDMGIGIFRTVRHYIQVDDHRFRIRQENVRQFRNGETYRVYYAPHSATFLGALALVQENDAVAAAESLTPKALLDPLTDREVEILQLIAAGLSNKEIAAQLSLSTNTVKMYASQLYQKLDVNRRTEAVARAREIGLLEN
jgi:DNA-binding CsgD family transcriptional regulator